MYQDEKTYYYIDRSDRCRENQSIDRTCTKDRRRDHIGGLDADISKNGHWDGKDHSGRNAGSTTSSGGYEFQQLAKKSLEKIYQNGHIPIVVGGTGFYIQALLYDVQFQEEREGSSYRKTLEEIARTEGAEVLHERLKKVDPESAKAIHKNNVKRVIRALEYYEETGNPISAHNKEQRENESPYNFLYIVLTMDRKKLYARINRRVDQMAEQGLAEEVTGLHEEGYDKGLTSMQAIGYKEWFPFFEGNCSKEEVIEQIKKDTRHFAKRQLTWFRRERDVQMIDKDQFATESDIVEEIIRLAKEKGIL